MTRVAAQLAGNAIERIRAESRLRETIERLNLAETVAQFGIWDCNFQTDVMTLSAGLALMMERPASQFQLTAAEFHAMVHPEDKQRLYDTGGPTKARTGTIQDEFRVVLPSGATRWVRSRWCYEPGESPPTRAGGAMIDITREREEAAETKRELERAEAATLVANKAEKLEQDRNEILELVANDQPLDAIIAAMAEAYRVALAPHNPQGPVSTAASLEFGFATPSYIICEAVLDDVPWRSEVVREGFTIEPKGRIVYPNTLPGLGVEIDEEAIKKHPFEQEVLLRTFYRDGSVGDW